MRPIKSLSVIKVTPTTILFKVEIPENYNPIPAIVSVYIYQIEKNFSNIFPIGLLVIALFDHLFLKHKAYKLIFEIAYTCISIYICLE